ncbi:MAG: hypothetical protein QNJ48_13745 [Desulfobacterales bacterium]|nr:hypothetical protein [Desulfobacterales bacterium]
MDNEERETKAMPRRPEKITTHKAGHAFPDFEMAADDLHVNDDRPLDRRDHDPRTDYRLWHCNGVPIGVRLHKK